MLLELNGHLWPRRPRPGVPDVAQLPDVAVKSRTAALRQCAGKKHRRHPGDVETAVTPEPAHRSTLRWRQPPVDVVGEREEHGRSLDAGPRDPALAADRRGHGGLAGAQQDGGDRAQLSVGEAVEVGADGQVGALRPAPVVVEAGAGVDQARRVAGHVEQLAVEPRPAGPAAR